jgi:hypothetical protein
VYEAGGALARTAKQRNKAEDEKLKALDLGKMNASSTAESTVSIIMIVKG